MKLILLLSVFLIYFLSFGQNGTISGRVYYSVNNNPIEFAKIQLIGRQKGAISDSIGRYSIDGIEPGLYALKVSVYGYKELIVDDISVTNSRPVQVDLSLEEIFLEQDEVTVKANPFSKTIESPLSFKKLSSAEIERLPGANRDASKVLQALPGVASPASFRNDVIIRGGSPNENKFYLDGIEVPNINHFATQGSSGGPVGLLNINFLQGIDFYSGGFPAQYGSGLSSVINFRQKEGNKDALITNLAIGSSDVALTLDGPIGKKTSFIFSVRRSYLQLLFSVLKLPFLPTYNDSQFKVDYKINNKNKITFIGLGALDKFVLNSKVNEGVTDEERLELNDYFLDNIPSQNQWNYTIGINYLHYSDKSNQRFIFSRNMLNNASRKYENNIETPENLVFDYSSFEAENKFRFENTWIKEGFKVLSGFGYEYARYQSNTFNNIIIGNQPTLIDVTSNLDLHKFAGFAQVSRSFFKEKLDLSVGVRTDLNTYSKSMTNALNQLSPSFSINFAATNNLSFSGNVARYNQLPSYTILGYRDNSGVLKNKENNLRYIQADHFIMGSSFISNFESKFSLEGFYKKYNYYPFSITDSISLANLGADFGVVGNEEVSSTSTGRSYGIEFLYQQKLIKGFYCLLAYTYVNSEFKTKNGQYAPSTWDSKHIVSITGGKRFKKNWEVGFRWTFSGGSPFTPYDLETSSLTQVWDLNNSGVLDYDQLNQNRGGSYHNLNIRIDKRFSFEKWSLTLYLDIQNVYNFKAKTAPILLVQKDDLGNPQIDPNDSSRYLIKTIANSSGTIQPSIGIIVDFRIQKKH